MFSSLIALVLVAVAPQAVMPLQAMDRDDANATHTRGTGCSWNEGKQVHDTWLIAMTDDRAAVKIDGKLTLLAPTPEAVDLFPFTFDKWIGEDGTLFTIQQNGESRQVGVETIETPAMLTITKDGVSSKWQGTLNCGS